MSRECLCIPNPAILRSARRFCATGILPVLGHGQDGHGTPLVAAQPRYACLFPLLHYSRTNQRRKAVAAADLQGAHNGCP